MADNPNKQKKILLNIVLIFIVIALAVVPFFVAKNAAFKGADNKAKDAINEVAPNYKPWFSSIWTPPSSEVESLLFALQAAVGAGIIGFGLGYIKGKSKGKDEK